MDLKEFILKRLSLLPREELLEALATHILKNDLLREEWRESQRREPTEAVSESQEKVSIAQPETGDQRRISHG